MSGNKPSSVSAIPQEMAEAASEAVEQVLADPTEEKIRKILGKRDILTAEDMATEEVEVPEWGGVVIVRALTGVERDSYEAEIFGSGQPGTYNLQNIRAKLAARTMIDEMGVRLFGDSEVAKLGLKSASALDRVFAVAQRLSGLTNQDVKELEAQLSKGLSDASGSGLLES